MRELFYEESSTIIEEKKEKRKYILSAIVSILLFVLSVFLLFLNIFSFKIAFLDGGILIAVFNILLYFGVPVLFFLAGLFFLKVKNTFFNEFDYTIISGSLRFSKVIIHKKRKFLFSFDASNIDSIGKTESEKYEKISKTPKVVIDNFSSNKVPMEGKDFYYLYALFEGKKHLIIIECSEVFIKNILLFTHSTVLDKDLK